MIQSLTSLSITGNIDPIYHHTTRTTHRRAPSDRLRAPLQVLNTEVTDTSRERPYAHTTQTNTPKQWYALESTSILLADVPRGGLRTPPSASFCGGSGCAKVYPARARPLVAAAAKAGAAAVAARARRASRPQASRTATGMRTTPSQRLWLRRIDGQPERARLLRRGQQSSNELPHRLLEPVAWTFFSMRQLSTVSR